jgi:hypothetical protein
VAAPLSLGLSRLSRAVLLEDEKKTEAELDSERRRLDAEEEEALAAREARELRRRREQTARPH